MVQHEKSNNGTLGYLVGFWLLVGCWAISFLVSGMVEPQAMLEFRILLNIIAVIYFLGIYLIQTLRQFNLTRKRRNQVIIFFNGKKIALEKGA
ncbi:MULTISPECIES: hypothetical protein [unclassified Sutcliffiella]|jgi:hypothetical protein|uniref:hypothetical protein n=1 Tax=unclassified Sutcliffiella TaxID=2837532 RepID=UPI0030D27513